MPSTEALYYALVLHVEVKPEGVQYSAVLQQRPGTFLPCTTKYLISLFFIFVFLIFSQHPSTTRSMEDIERLKARRALYVAKGSFSIPTVVVCPTCLMGIGTTFDRCLEDVSGHDIAREVTQALGKPYQVSLISYLATESSSLTF